VRTKLAQLIATEEGFFRQGTQPERKHNPGDLRHSPHSSHEGEGADDIGIIDTEDHGWEDLERQLQLYAARGLTLEETIAEFAPPSENDTTHYLQMVCEGLGLDSVTLVAEALKIAA
jgi:hypothetical protein